MKTYEYEVAFSFKEMLQALAQAAVNTNRLPSGVLLSCVIDYTINNDTKEITTFILKANKSDKST